MDCDFVGSAVAVSVGNRRLVLQLVMFLGVLGDVGRRRDVRDRRDVVPVDAMAQAEHEGGHEQSDGIGLSGHGADYCIALQ